MVEISTELPSQQMYDGAGYGTPEENVNSWLAGFLVRASIPVTSRLG